MSKAVKIMVFWDVTLKFDTYLSTFSSPTMMMEAAGSSKISVCIYKKYMSSYPGKPKSWLSACLQNEYDTSFKLNMFVSLCKVFKHLALCPVLLMILDHVIFENTSKMNLKGKMCFVDYIIINVIRSIWMEWMRHIACTGAPTHTKLFFRDLMSSRTYLG